MADAPVGDAAGARPAVFISHSSQDVTAARELRTVLARHGYAAWMAPDDIDGQATWVDQILAAAKSCPTMIVLLSRHCVQSPHVAREVALALDHGRAVVPIRIEPVALSGPLEYLLHLVQWVDAFPGSLAHHQQAILTRLASATGMLPAPTVAPVRRSRHRRLWLAAASVAVVAVATAVVVAATRSSDPPAQAGDALAAIPTRLATPSALQDYLPAVGLQSHLPSGPAVTLRSAANLHGSLGFRVPIAWTHVSGANPYDDESNRRIGDLLSATADETAFKALTGSGLFVGVAVPPRGDIHSVDEQSVPQNYYDLGCLSSKVIQIARPFLGQVRVWGACRVPMVVVPIYFETTNATISVLAIVTTQHELEQLATVLGSVHVDVGKVPPAR